MREYIFHGKRVDNGEWIEGYYACESNHACFQCELKHRHYIFRDEFMDWSLGGLCQYEVIPESVGQYTGMNEFVASDRAFDRPLFEGDIVEVWSNRSPKYTRSAASQYDGEVVVRATICFRHGSWTLDYKNKYNESLAKLRGKETDERTVAGYWELYSFGPYNSNEEWIRKNGYKWHDIKKIGTVYENTDLLEG